MFGSLVVCLPSPHEGGEVVVKHCGEKKVFSTSSAAQSFVCWYSDVSHEVLPVTAGYGWVLTYNLAIDPAVERPSATLQRSETAALRDVLQRWLAGSENGSRDLEYVYHVLDHDYTEANMSLRGLKTRDLAQVQVLKDLAAELPIDVFLALLEKEEQGDCTVEYDHYDHWGGGRRYTEKYNKYDSEDGSEDGSEDVSEAESDNFHPLDEVFDMQHRIKKLIDLDGREVMSGLPLDEDHILQNDCFDGADAEEEFEGYMGNSVRASRELNRCLLRIH